MPLANRQRDRATSMLTLAVLIAAAATGLAHDRPEYRGPGRPGTCTEAAADYQERAPDAGGGMMAWLCT